MLEHRPVLKERLLACAVFGALGIGVLAASDVMVTGGFDFPSTERSAHADTPNYFQIAAETWSERMMPEANVQDVAWNEALPLDADYSSYEAETLVGAADDPDARFIAQRQGPTEEELGREIASMYAALPSASDDSAYADEAYAEESHYDDADSAEAAGVSDGKDASAYANASPW
jgi:hypothetical protein